MKTRDLGTKWPHWHTLMFSDDTKKRHEICAPKGHQKDAGTESPIRKLEEVGSKARV